MTVFDSLTCNADRRRISMVSQKVNLFVGSIKENVLYGLDDAQRLARGFDGPEASTKGEKLLHDTLTFFVQSTPQDPVYADELSDFFEDTLVESFACDAEDGSCREVADAIVRQFTMCVVNGTFSEADQIIAQAPVAAARALQQSQTVPDDTSAVFPDGADGAAAANRLRRA